MTVSTVEPALSPGTDLDIEDDDQLDRDYAGRLMARGKVSATKPFAAHPDYDHDEACLWLWYKFREAGGRVGAKNNTFGYGRLYKMICERYGIIFEEWRFSDKREQQEIKRMLLRGRKLALASKTLPYEERLAQNRSDIEVVLADGYRLRSLAMDAVDYKGRPKVDVKLLIQADKVILAATQRLSELDGLDAPLKVAVKADVTSTVRLEAAANEQVDRVSSLLGAATARIERVRADPAAISSLPMSIVDAEIVEDA